MKAPSLILAVSLSFAALPAFAAGGDGGPFNGPTLSPISVPAMADHPVTEFDLIDATKICFASGDAAHGVKSVMQQIMDQIYPGAKLRFPDTIFYVKAATSSNTATANEWSVDNGFVIDRVKSLHPNNSHELTPVSPDDLQYLAVVNTGKLTVYFSDDGKPAPAGDGGDTQVISTGALPTITANYNYQYTYDKWGKVTNTTKTMSDVRINTDGQDLTFVNSETNHSVPLVISVKDYVQCLQGEIQNLASKH